MWQFLRPYLWPYRWLLVLGVTLTSISGAAMSARSIAPKYLVDNVLLAPGLTQHERVVRLISFILVYLTVVVFLCTLSWHLSFRVLTHVRERLIFALRSQFFRQINALCLRFHLKHTSGELYSYLFGSPLQQVQQYFFQLTMMGIQSAFMLVTTLIWVFTWDWAISAVFILSLVCNLALMRFTRRRIKALQSDFQTTEGTVGGYVADLIRGNKTIKLHGVESQVIEQFDSHALIIGRKTYDRDIQGHVQSMKQEATNYVIFTVLAAVCAWRFWGGHISSAEALVSLGALATLSFPIQQLFLIANLHSASEISLGRLQELLAEQSSTPDPVQRDMSLPKKGDIVFQDVTFRYDQQPVYRDFNLTIPYGQRIALVGPSGSGKSTLTQLLLRFYDPDQGAVSLRGHDLKNFRSRDLRRLFGVVPQEPYLFSTTLRDNLRLIETDADDARIIRACKMANAWEFIEKLPKGLDTIVGESGSTLSGGQRQRLAIARALLPDPPFFIFDEATSALDTLSEQLIQESLDRILVGKTAIFIAHRLSTVATCDRVLVLQEGHIIQDGTYTQLSAQPGLFRTMVESSAGTNRPVVGVG